MKFQNLKLCSILLLLFSINLSLYAKDVTPQSTPTLYYQIPTSVKKLDKLVFVDLENIQTDNFIVKVTINGKGPYQFMLDTGIANTMISQKVATELNLQNPQEKYFTGNNTNKKALHYNLKELSLGEATLYDYDAAVLEEPNVITNFIKAHQFNIDGILAVGAFYHYLLTLDYPHKRIALVSGELDKADKNTIAFAPTERVPVIVVEFKDSKTKLEVNCLLDTGFGGQFTFPTSITPIPFKIIEGHQVTVNAGFNEYVVYKDKIEAKAYFSDKVIENPTIIHGNGIYGKSGEYFGLMGLDVIHQYRMTLDQKNRLLKIEE